MVEELAEEALAVGGVAARIHEVRVPHKVHERRGRELGVRVLLLEREELLVLDDREVCHLGRLERGGVVLHQPDGEALEVDGDDGWRVRRYTVVLDLRGAVVRRQTAGATLVASRDVRVEDRSARTVGGVPDRLVERAAGAPRRLAVNPDGACLARFVDRLDRARLEALGDLLGKKEARGAVSKNCDVFASKRAIVDSFTGM